MRVWKDGSDLKKTTMHSKPLEDEVEDESDAESEPESEAEDDRTRLLRKRIANMMREGGRAGTGKTGAVAKARIVRFVCETLLVAEA